MKITTEKLLEIQSRVGVIKTNAEDRHVITDECDAISKIIQKVIEDATLSG